MVAAFGGPNVRCTAYAPYGTQELSDLVVEGLRERHGVLLGQHGMVVTGRDLGQAMWRAVELETLAKMYVVARSIGRPHILPDEEIALTVERFKSYGYQSQTVAALDAATSKNGRGSPAPRSQKRTEPAYHTPVLGMDFHGSSAGLGSPFCKSSMEISSGERMKAMWPSRGGRLMVTPAFCNFAHVA